ncbi:hypothetical protein HPCPY6271_0316 [Helicobacter pylori CPY6271]|nr:hypothetical protein [Helicobacter pylori]EJB25803.1 hypothetical protein HPCPY6271_0316 [Helicobacter pylori CPY6271]
MSYEIIAESNEKPIFKNKSFSITEPKNTHSVIKKFKNSNAF